MLPHCIGTEFAHKSVPVGDELAGPLVELLELVRGIELTLLPVETQPAYVLFDRFDVLVVFLCGIGIVEPQVTETLKLRGDAEIEADRLGVADVKIAVGFGREAGVYAAIPFLGRLVCSDNLFDKVQGTIPISGAFIGTGFLSAISVTISDCRPMKMGRSPFLTMFAPLDTGMACHPTRALVP